MLKAVQKQMKNQMRMLYPIAKVGSSVMSSLALILEKVIAELEKILECWG